MLAAWLGNTPNGFHLAVDGDGCPLAMMNMLPVSDQTHEVTQMRLTAFDPQEQRVVVQVRQALRDIHRPARLAANPLLAWLELSTAEDLRTTLLLAIQALCSSDAPAEAEAGDVLAGYYLSRRGGHEHVANRLHLSRSTYFRRLNHGIVLLTSRLPRPILGA